MGEFDDTTMHQPAEDGWSHEQYVRLESLTQAVNHSHGRGTQWDVIRVANDFANYVNTGEGATDAEA